MIQVDHHLIFEALPHSRLQDMHRADLVFRDGQVVKCRWGIEHAQAEPEATLNRAVAKGLNIMWITAGWHHQWYLDVHDDTEVEGLDFKSVYSQVVHGLVTKSW